MVHYCGFAVDVFADESDRRRDDMGYAGNTDDLRERHADSLHSTNIARRSFQEADVNFVGKCSGLRTQIERRLHLHSFEMWFLESVEFALAVGMYALDAGVYGVGLVWNISESVR